MTKNLKSWIYALAAVLLWSTVASAFKLTLEGMDFAHFLLYTSLFSFLILFILVLTNPARTKGLFTLSVLKKGAILGLLNPFLYYLVLFKAYELLPAQEAQPLNYTWPVTISIFAAIFLGQKLTRYNYIGLLVSFFGVWVISTRGDIFAAEFSNPLGVMLAVGSSVIWASYWILNLMLKEKDALKLTSGFFFGTLYSLLFILFTSELIIPEAEYLGGALYVGAFEMGITFILWMRGMKYSDNKAITASLANLAPFISMLFIAVILKEEILRSSMAGLVLIIGGILIQNIPKLLNPGNKK